MNVTIHTNFGNIKLELYPDKAPITVDNFLHYVRSGFYKQTLFHRISPGFAIQGGGYDINGTAKWPRRDPIPNEADNLLANAPYTVAMARLVDDPNSATCEFFINLGENLVLNYCPSDPERAYCVFGKVIDGFDVIDAITAVKTEKRGPHDHLPLEKIVIEDIVIDEETEADAEHAPADAAKAETETITDEEAHESEWPGPIVRLVTNRGDIDIVLFPEEAPQSVDNFLRYVRDGFYNGTVFHRVIDGFMIQGGGYDAQLNSKPRHDSIPYEGNNGLDNLHYTVAMARAQALDSASSEFFINVVDNPSLDHANRGPEGGYAVFGRVVDGFNVVDAIAKTPVAPRGFHAHVPTEPVVIENAFVAEETPQ